MLLISPANAAMHKMVICGVHGNIVCCRIPHQMCFTCISVLMHTLPTMYIARVMVMIDPLAATIHKLITVTHYSKTIVLIKIWQVSLLG